jgi:hypothetical protein
MQRQAIVMTAVAVCVLVLAGTGSIADPIKWSAPLSDYPTPWAPTPEPPNYYNPYGYRYPYGGYGYGATDYYGYGGYGYMGGYPAYQGYQRRGFSGNPYMYYYGQ